MAIVFAIRKWRHYLLGQKFYICIDKKSLKFLMEQREVNPEYQKWLIKLTGYQFEIRYKPGNENKAADALSWISSSAELLALTTPIVLQLGKLAKEVEADLQLQEIIRDIQKNPSSKPDYAMVSG